jgi:hypothetical protein
VDLPPEYRQLADIWVVLEMLEVLEVPEVLEVLEIPGHVRIGARITHE